MSELICDTTVVQYLHQVPFTGTPGLLLDAKRARRISSIAPYVDELRRRSFHLSLRARAAILHEAGETP